MSLGHFASYRYRLERRGREGGYERDGRREETATDRIGPMLGNCVSCLSIHHMAPQFNTPAVGLNFNLNIITVESIQKITTMSFVHMRACVRA